MTATETPVLRLADVTVGYHRQAVLSDLTFQIRAGELVGVLGPSGSGKTTLLRLLTGHAHRLAGTAEVLGRPLDPRRPPRVGYVPQVGEGDLEFPLTVEQTVLLGATADSSRRPWFTRDEKARAGQLLERLGLAGLQRRPIALLSGGQRQRMLIARALMHDIRLLLLDEPTSGVDMQVRKDILALVGDLARDHDITVLLTTHDLNWVAAHLPRVLCVNHTLVADGTPADALTPQVLEATYATRMHVVRDGHRLLIADEQPLLHDEVWT